MENMSLAPLYAFENWNQIWSNLYVDGLQKMGLLMLMTTMQWVSVPIVVLILVQEKTKTNTQCSRMTVLQKLGKLVSLTMK
jgi:hypothetical protein